MSIREFIEARLAEDREAIEIWKLVPWDEIQLTRVAVMGVIETRVAFTEDILEAAAAMLDYYGDWEAYDYVEPPIDAHIGVVLARQWADHADFQPEWAKGYEPPEPEPEPVRPPVEPMAAEDRFTIASRDLTHEQRRQLESFWSEV